MSRRVLEAGDLSVSPAERKLLMAYGDQLCAAYLVGRLEGFVHNLNGPLQILWLRGEQMEKDIAALGDVSSKGSQDECGAVAKKLGTRVDSFLKAFGQLDDSLQFVTKDLVGKCRCACEALSVNEVLRDVFFLMKADMFFKHQVDLQWNPGEAAATVYGRHNHLCAVFLSIIQNGLEAMVDESVRELRIHVTSDDDKVLTHIENTGSGIDEEASDRLFELFFTTKNGQTYNGTKVEHEGLGLPLAFVLISEYGGKLAFERGTEKTRFSVEFPAYHSPKG